MGLRIPGLWHSELQQDLREGVLTWNVVEKLRPTLRPTLCRRIRVMAKAEVDG